MPSMWNLRDDRAALPRVSKELTPDARALTTKLQYSTLESGNFGKGLRFRCVAIGFDAFERRNVAKIEEQTDCPLGKNASGGRNAPSLSRSSNLIAGIPIIESGGKEGQEYPVRRKNPAGITYVTKATLVLLEKVESGPLTILNIPTICIPKMHLQCFSLTKCTFSPDQETSFLRKASGRAGSNG